jgi:DMSO/TMAO reductase YedYZ molybdopterin-dependent catalytic subunit
MDLMNPIAEANAAADAPAISTDFALTGQVLRPLSLSVDQLRGYESVRVAPFDLRCFTTNRFIRTVGCYRGVRLTDLIEEAGLRNDSPGDFKRAVFIAMAHDGYAVTFSWHELFNTSIGETVLVAYECDDQPLTVEDGVPTLYSGTDIMAAPRHVKRLARVVVRVLKPESM